jgi:dissimilatory sulfite reductase (desulfoviridin) alpha/beta subunit
MTNQPDNRGGPRTAPAVPSRFALTPCAGWQGRCPCSLEIDRNLASRLAAVGEAADFPAFYAARVKGPLRRHHYFTIALAGCPNACSQPQIADIGIIARRQPIVTREGCTGCKACVDACPDNAISVGGTPPLPTINTAACVSCGRCITVCPSGTLAAGQNGYELQMGGMLGRHPQLARPVAHYLTADAVIDLVRHTITWYQNHCRSGERLGAVIKHAGLPALLDTDRA